MFHLVIDSPHIFAENAKANQLNAAEEQNGNHHGGKSGTEREVNLGELLGKNSLKECEDGSDESERRDREAEIGGQAQGRRRKGGDAIPSQG